MKRIAPLLLALLLALTALPLPTPAAADDNIPINEATFPDPVFRAWVKNHADTDGDGTLNTGELGAVTYIGLEEKGVADMTGLQYFSCLDELDVTDNYLTSLDVSGNPLLTCLACGENRLTYLDLTNNPSLQSLDVGYNDIEAIDLGCPLLLEFTAEATLLRDVDVSGCPELVDMDLSGCERLTALDVRDNPRLRFLDCDGCGLKALDVTYNPILEVLYVHNNGISQLDLSQNHRLRGLYTYGNPLAVVDLRGCPNLADAVERAAPSQGHYFDDYYTEYSLGSCYLRTATSGQEVLTAVPVTAAFFPDETLRGRVADADLDGDGMLSRREAKAVTELNLNGEYDVTDLTGLCFLPELETLNVSRTGVTELDLSCSTVLRELDVTHTPIRALDVYNCELLFDLFCYDTPITHLDISNNGGLGYAQGMGSLVRLTDDLTGNSYWHYYYYNSSGGFYYVLDMDPDMAVTMNPVKRPRILTQPADVSAELNETVQFHAEAESASDYPNAAVWYQWQYKTASGWKNSGLAGNDTAALSVKATAARDGQRYRCVVTDSFGKRAVTHDAALTVVSKPAVTAQPASQTAAADTTVKFTVKASGGGLTYQWYYKAPGGSWAKSALTGCKTATLTVKATAARDGYQYKCRVSNAAGYVYTNAVTLTVASKPVITTQPKSQTAAPDTTVKFTVKATGEDLTYQWYYRTSAAGTWKKSTLTGAKTATLTVKATEARNGYQYKCKVSNAVDGYVYTSAATLTVSAKPVITTQPRSQTASAGATVKFTVKATGATAYQWYYRTSSTGTWTKCTGTGCKTATLTVEAKSYRNGYQYKCRVSNDNGHVYTSAVTLTVTK